MRFHRLIIAGVNAMSSPAIGNATDQSRGLNRCVPLGPVVSIEMVLVDVKSVRCVSETESRLETPYCSGSIALSCIDTDYLLIVAMYMPEQINRFHR